MVIVTENKALRMTHLYAEDPNAKLKVKLEIEPIIDHPLYGSSGKLCGEYKLFNSSASYTPSNYFLLGYDQQKQIIEDTKVRIRAICDNMDEDEFTDFTLFCNLCVALCMPLLEAPSEIFEVGADTMAFIFRSDDQLEAYKEMDNIAYLYRKGYLEAHKQAKNPKFKKYQQNHWQHYLKVTNDPLSTKDKEYFKKEALSYLPDLEPAIPMLRAISHKIRRTYPHQVPKSVKLGVIGVGHHFEGLMFWNNTGLGSKTLSEKALTMFRGHDAGMAVCLEVIATHEGYLIPKYIRQMALFKWFMNCVSEYGGLTNDIAGLMKDVHDEATLQNLILRKVVHEKISLEESFAQTMKSLQNLISDMELCIQVFSEAFPEEEGLAKFIKSAKDLCDGQTLGYVIGYEIKVRRYTDSTLKICPMENEKNGSKPEE